MILSVQSDLSKFKKVSPSTFMKLNIWERTHIEEWIRQIPELLGEQLLVVSVEFDRFVNSSDRLDILAIDRNGNLVVVELKRDAYAGYADLQALRYAAMVSSMTIDQLIPYYEAYRNKYSTAEEEVSINPRTEIEEFVSKDDFEELSNRPRIILCSENFSQEITTTVLWLNQFNVNISCVRITPYDMGEFYVVVPDRIIPLKEAQQYLIDIQRKEEIQELGKSKSKRTMPIIIENKLLNAGDLIYLKRALPKYLEFKEGDPLYLARITGKNGQSNAVKWELNNEEYSISALTYEIFKDNHPDKRFLGGVNGNLHWVNEDGVCLYELAQNFQLNPKD